MLPEEQADGPRAADATATPLGKHNVVRDLRRRRTDGLHGAHLLPDQTQQDLERKDGPVHSAMEGM